MNDNNKTLLHRPELTLARSLFRAMSPVSDVTENSPCTVGDLWDQVTRQQNGQRKGWLLMSRAVSLPFGGKDAAACVRRCNISSALHPALGLARKGLDCCTGCSPRHFNQLSSKGALLKSIFTCEGHHDRPLKDSYMCISVRFAFGFITCVAWMQETGAAPRLTLMFTAKLHRFPVD